MQPPLTLLLAVLACGASACGVPAGNHVKPAETQDWLFRTCGVRLAQPPTLVANDAGARRRATENASGSVAVPEAELPAVLESLRLNPQLHLRGQSETRYSYESTGDGRPQRSCELDRALRVLYFSYRE